MRGNHLSGKLRAGRSFLEDFWCPLGEACFSGFWLCVCVSVYARHAWKGAANFQESWEYFSPMKVDCVRSMGRKQTCYGLTCVFFLYCVCSSRHVQPYLFYCGETKQGEAWPSSPEKHVVMACTIIELIGLLISFTLKRLCVMLVTSMLVDNLVDLTWR